MPTVDLVASYWTLATGGYPHTDHEYSTWSFEDRVAEAAKAGFRGMGLWHSDLEHTLQRLTLKDIKRVLDEHGMIHIELEFLADWFTEGEKRKQSDATRRLLIDAAEALGAHHIKVGDFFNTPCPMPRLVECFAALCADAAKRGTLISFELMPFANINTLQGALDLCSQADAKNGGIIFDLWHIVKLGIPYDAVARTPARFLHGVEINDGYIKNPPTKDLAEETTRHRLFCGDGDFDVKGFVTTMLRAGYRGPWGIEVLNKDSREQPVPQVARRAFDTTRAQFPA
jgi:sugar phosphate isomerase/epimerase